MQNLSRAALLIGIVLSVATSPAEWSATDEADLGILELSPASPYFAIDATFASKGTRDIDWMSLSVDLTGENDAVVSGTLVLYALEEPFEGEIPGSAVRLGEDVIPGGFADEPAEFTGWVAGSLPIEREYHLVVVLEGEADIVADARLRVDVSTGVEPETALTVNIEVQ